MDHAVAALDAYATPNTRGPDARHLG